MGVESLRLRRPSGIVAAAKRGIYFDYGKRRIHRRHYFRDYMLFAVDEKQQITVPKAKPAPWWNLVRANGRTPKQKSKRAVLIAQNGPFLDLILAVTYVPTQLPVQYHRPCEA